MRRTTCFNVASSPIINHVPCVKPTIVEDPQGANLDVDDSWTMEVVASGTAPLTYQWYHNDLAMPGETAAELQIVYAVLSDAGRYRAKVSNACGEKFSNTAVIAVDGSSDSCVSPTIITHPTPVIVPPGTDVAFVVEAEGSAPLTYQWYKDVDGTVTELTGETSPELQIIYAEEDDQAAYFCKVTNACGEINSAPAMLNIETDDGDSDGGGGVFIDDTI